MADLNLSNLDSLIERLTELREIIGKNVPVVVCDNYDSRETFHRNKIHSVLYDKLTDSEEVFIGIRKCFLDERPFTGLQIGFGIDNEEV